MTPGEAADRLGVDAKRVRTWLRRHREAPSGRRWRIDETTFDEMRAAFTLARGSSAASRVRDEIYVIDLCDEMFGIAASRQHRFDWLTGDPGRDGRSRTLPVDAYYQPLKLVVEYGETQHVAAVPFFDKPDLLTVSGVDRGRQRRLYDERRHDLIPRHGLRLWVIAPADMGGDRRGRLSSRNHERDLELLRSAWRRFT